MTRQLTALAALIAVCTGAQAEIYKWTDSKGKTHYSNSKPTAENSEVLSIQEKYVPGTPAHRSLPSNRRTAGAPQSHYLHAPSPGAPLDQCKRTKVDAVYAAKANRRTTEKNLEDWLWKNCRTYSRELRKIEQEMM